MSDYVDGNMLAGVLGELFAVDVTTAVGTCVSCGTSGAIAQAHVYPAAPARGEQWRIAHAGTSRAIGLISRIGCSDPVTVMLWAAVVAGPVDHGRPAETASSAAAVPSSAGLAGRRLRAACPERPTTRLPLPPRPRSLRTPHWSRSPAAR